MPVDAGSTADEGTCLEVRQAARRITQFFDEFLAPVGLRSTQFSILAKLRRLGPMMISVLAGHMVMDRTTLGRNILPLKREGLISIVKGSSDGRSKELSLTEDGAARLRVAVEGWTLAQARFEAVFGGKRTMDLHTLLHAVTTSDFGTAPAGRP